MRPDRWSGLVAVVVLLAGLLGSAGAREAVVLGADTTVDLEVREGRLVRLPAPAAAVFVADPDIADVQVHSPSLIYVFGKKAGSTSLFAVDAQEQPLLRADVTVTHHLSALQRILREVAPDARLEVRSLDGAIVLQGAVRDPTVAQEIREVAGRYLGENETLINRIQVAAPTQVNLRVRVAEVNREVTKLFGINWDTAFAPGDFLFGLATGRPFTNLGGFPFTRLDNLEATPATLARPVPERRRHRQRPARRARDRRPRQCPGRAEPDGAVGRDRELPRRRRVPDPGRHRRRPDPDRVQAVRRQPRLHARPC